MSLSCATADAEACIPGATSLPNSLLRLFNIDLHVQLSTPCMQQVHGVLVALLCAGPIATCESMFVTASNFCLI